MATPVLRRTPAPITLRALAEADADVLVEHLSWQAVCHLLTADRQAARCGALHSDNGQPLTSENGCRVGAYRLLLDSARLCPACSRDGAA